MIGALCALHRGHGESLSRLASVRSHLTCTQPGIAELYKPPPLDGPKSRPTRTRASGRRQTRRSEPAHTWWVTTTDRSPSPGRSRPSCRHSARSGGPPPCLVYRLNARKATAAATHAPRCATAGNTAETRSRADSEAAVEMESAAASLCCGATAQPRGARPAQFAPHRGRVRSPR